MADNFTTPDRRPSTGMPAVMRPSVAARFDPLARNLFGNDNNNRRVGGTSPRPPRRQQQQPSVFDRLGSRDVSLWKVSEEAMEELGVEPLSEKEVDRCCLAPAQSNPSDENEMPQKRMTRWIKDGSKMKRVSYSLAMSARLRFPGISNISNDDF